MALRNVSDNIIIIIIIIRCVFVCCLIAVPLPPGKTPFAVQLNN
jgi:hypothetical protein